MICLFDALFILLPLIVIFSGMAMPLVLVVLTVFILLAIPRSAIRTPQLWLNNYRMLFGLLALILVWPVITSIWSITPERSLFTALRILLIYFMGAVAFTYSAALPPMRACKLHWLAGSIVLLSLLLLSEHRVGGGIIHWIDGLAQIDYERYISKNVNRGLCALTVLIWPVMFGFYRLGKKRQAWCLMALMGLAIMLMHSLSAKVGLISGIIAFFAIRRFPVTVPRAINILFPLFLLSFPILFVLMEPTVFADPTVRAHLPESAIHRLNIWHELLEHVVQKPIFGWGMDTSRAMPMTQHALEVLHLLTPPLHPHSPSLQLLLELGIVGLLLAVTGITLLIRQWVVQPREDLVKYAIAGSLIVSYFAAGVSSFGIWQYWWIAVLWIAAILWRRMDKISLT